MRSFFRATICAAVVFCALQPAAADESLGDKLKKIFDATPTPTPRRHRAHPKKKSSPTPSPTPSVHHRKASPTPSPSPVLEKKVRHKKKSPTPAETTPEPKKPSPTPTPEPTPEETPTPSASETPSPTASAKEKTDTTATISPNDIAGYDKYPAPVRKILDSALDLTRQHLAYTYGSSDPATGGMDCSGFVYFVLHKNGVSDVPRDSSEQYVWIRKSGNFRAVLSRKPDTFELDALKPGDLLFWTGTYSIERDPPVTHTMIYVGREKKTDKRIMVGASDGRTYDGKQRFGVSIFDFKLAKPPASNDSKLSPSFVGYGSIPNLPNEQ